MDNGSNSDDFHNSGVESFPCSCSVPLFFLVPLFHSHIPLLYSSILPSSLSVLFYNFIHPCNHSFLPLSLPFSIPPFSLPPFLLPLFLPPSLPSLPSFYPLFLPLFNSSLPPISLLYSYLSFIPPSLPTFSLPFPSSADHTFLLQLILFMHTLK